MKRLFRLLAILLGIGELAIAALMFFGFFGAGRVLDALVFLVLGITFLSYGLSGRPTLGRLGFDAKDEPRDGTPRSDV